MLSPSDAVFLRRLSIGDEVTIKQVLAAESGPHECTDHRNESLVRLGALIVQDPPLAAYQREVQRGLDAGLSVDDIIAAFRAVGPQAGSSLIIRAAPKLAMALGYDVEFGLEEFAADPAAPLDLAL